jgi:uncharacterized phage protein (TIGR02216 family)
MIAGLGHLGLAPRDFWAMTPRELDAALRGHYGLTAATQPLSRTALTTLMQAFPDTP